MDSTIKNQSQERVSFRSYVILALSLFVIFFYLENVTFKETPSFIFRFISSVADASLFFTLLSLLRGKWRILRGIIVLLLTLIVFSNVIFLRTFGDLIPSTAYFNSDLGDPTVINGAIDACHVPDVILVIAGLTPLVYYLVAGRKGDVSRKTHRGIIKWSIIIMTVSWAVSVAGTYRRLSIYTGNTGLKTLTTDLLSDEKTKWKTPYGKLNFTGYMLTCVVDMCKSPYVRISSEQQKEVAAYISEKTNENKSGTPAFDDVKTNLILIVVESLETQSLHVSPEIYPVLDDLISMPSTVHVDSCRVLVSFGRSSDAQFIINTGLLPLRTEALVNKFAFKPYPSLAKALGKHSVELIGEDKSLWSHSLTTKSYGFESLIDNIAPGCNDQDSLIFRAASRELKNIKSPFFMFISTISMHDPYVDNKVSNRLPDNVAGLFQNAKDKEYFSRLNHFDTQLGLFLDQLDELGLYDSTLIVIVGDHEIRDGATSMPRGSTVPLLIVNAPSLPYRKRNVTQADIFPTLLYLMGKDSELMNVAYTGLGSNIFNLEGSGLPEDKDYEISEMIIRSN